LRTFIISRLIQSVVILIIVTIIVFVALHLLPGDPIYLIITKAQSQTLTASQLANLRHEYGLDKPLFLQYFNWVAGVFHGDFGTSITQHRSPLEIFASTAPRTLYLSSMAFTISFVFGILAGVICAIRRGNWVDTVITIMANIGITIPIFWLGTILIYLFALQLHWLPVQGYTSPLADFPKSIRQSVLPVACLSVFTLAAIARQTRSSMLEVMRQDYIRTAWAKGLRERSVVMSHALKNGLIPVVTLAGLGLSMILGGSVLEETVFNIQGTGLALVSAITAHDYPVVQTFTFFIAIVVLIINLVVDISFGWLDPRIRYE
jgi:peptide/nickel transport system permease protein